jgi:hypothetical protein
MKQPGRLKRFFTKKPARQQPTPAVDGPLREFVYLDDPGSVTARFIG